MPSSTSDPHETPTRSSRRATPGRHESPTARRCLPSWTPYASIGRAPAYRKRERRSSTSRYRLFGGHSRTLAHHKVLCQVALGIGFSCVGLKRVVELETCLAP